MGMRCSGRLGWREAHLGRPRDMYPLLPLFSFVVARGYARPVVVSAISLAVAVAGVAFGVYQWSRQRGRVRVQVDEGQAELYLRVVVDAPTPVHVNGIAYQMKARGRWRRLLHWLNDDELKLRRRFANMWRFRDFDLAMGWLERTAAWDQPVRGNVEIPTAFAPIAGPELPLTISGYDDASWKLYGANYVPMFLDTLERWAKKRPRVRFRVVVSGHPRRVVHSSWIPLADLSILKPENADWSGNIEGLPQVPHLSREERAEMDRLMHEEPENRLDHVRRGNDRA